MGAAAAWLMELLMSGAMAAVIFPTMKSLNPVIPGFEKMPQDHWALAAGSVMRIIFLIGDCLQCVLAAVSCVAAVMVIRGYQLRGVRAALLGVPLVVGVVAAVLSAVWLSPRMRSEMDDAIAAARAGKAEEAQAARARFTAMHPTSEALLGTATVATAALCVATLLSAKSPSEK